MISTNQFKNGSHIELDGQVFRIVEFQHVKPGKGGAFVRSKLKNVGTGAVIDKTFRAGEKVRPVRTEVRRMQYLYESGDEAVMMDMRDYDQVPLAKTVLGDSLDWMLPNDEVDFRQSGEHARRRFGVTATHHHQSVWIFALRLADNLA